jgi:hypothetical protein
MMMRNKKRRRVVDALDMELTALLEADGPTGRGYYQPIIGYIFERGPIVRYHPATWWYDFGRAVSSCWGSLARRMRGTWDADLNERGEPIRALLVVQRGDGSVAWKHVVDLREIRETP